MIIDEVSQPKKGDKSIGVARQHCGNRGKVENCQVSVCGYLTDFHQGSLIDMRLYLPESWTNNPARLKNCGLPSTPYRTKLQIAGQMIRDQSARGIEFEWVVADGFYGRDLSLALDIDRQKKQFLLEVSRDRKIYLEEPKLEIPEKKSKKGREPIKRKPDKSPVSLTNYAKSLTSKQFKKKRIRDTMKGNLIALVHTCTIWVWDRKSDQIVRLRLLIRKEKNKIVFAFSNVFDVEEKHLLKVQAWRYFIERSFQEAKNVVGMKYYQVRKYRGWVHYMAMILLLLLFLMNYKAELKDQLHPLVSYRDIKLCFQFFLPDKVEDTFGFLFRLFDNLEAKMADYMRYDHHFR